MKPIRALHEAGQSLWLGNITRGLLNDGTRDTHASKPELATAQGG